MVANALAAIAGAVEVIPRKWANVQCIYMKTIESVALPIYNAMPEPEEATPEEANAAGEEANAAGEATTAAAKAGVEGGEGKAKAKPKSKVKAKAKAK